MKILFAKDSSSPHSSPGGRGRIQRRTFSLLITVAAIALTLSPNGRTQAGAAARNSAGAAPRSLSAEKAVQPHLVPPSSGLKVALVASDLPSWEADVQAKLQATGRFSLIDIIQADSTTPTLAQLQAYDSVLVWSDGPFADATTLGNNLANYVDGGGGVVVAVFADASAPVGGRFAGDDYYALEPSRQFSSPDLTLGTVYNPSSPLMAGVSSFDGGASSYRTGGSPHANTLRVADWSDGEPLLVTRIIKGTPRVDLNFFPPSSDQRGDFWQSSTDGATLMANALEFVHPSCTAAPAGMSHWWPGDGDANDLAGSNDGTLQGSATFGSGEVRQAFSFSGGFPDKVDVGLVSLPSTKLSFAAWVNPATTALSPVVFSDSDGVNGFAVKVSSGSILAGASNGADDTVYATTSQLVANNEWHHIAVVFDGSASPGNRLIIYVDDQAQPVTVVVDNATTLSQSTVDTLIGNSADSQAPWTGLIDEVQLFDRVLTANEVAGIANAGHAGVCRSCASAPASLLGWWKGDGDATDSQNSNDGVFHGTPAFAAGEVGQGFSLNGTDQYVEIPSSPNLEAITGAISVDAWINPNDVSSQRAIVSKYDNNDSTGRSWALGINANGTVAWGVQNGFDNTCRYVDTPNPIPTGVFTHVTGTFDPNTQEVKIYINGVDTNATLEPGCNATVSSIGTKPTTPVEIGAYFNFSGAFFNGIIDEVEIFDRALTRREVQRIYDAFDGGKCPCVEAPSGMIAWWAGNDSAFDIQGAHDATLDGAGFGPGEVNHAFTFNGTNQKVNIPASNDWNFGTGGFTVDFWAQSSDSSDVMYALSFEPDPTFNGQNLDFDFNDSHGLWVFWNGGGGNNIQAGSAGAYTDGQWHHFALTRIGTTLTLYVDGAAAGAADYAPAIDLSGGSNNFIGARNINGTINKFWNGSIDEVEVFNRGLSADEVAGIYHAGGAGKCRPYYTVAVSSGAGGTAAGGASVRQGTPVEVSATADGCDTFAGWFENNQLVSSANPYDFVMKGANRNLVAKFNKIQYQISASASPVAGGTVTGAGPYDCGATATLKATSANGYSFVNWTENGNQVSTSATYTFTVNGNRTLVANFKQNSHLGTANGSGTISNQNNRPSFSFSISNNNKKGNPSGTLTWTDTKFNIRLTSTAITSITLVSNQATFSGKGTMPGSNPRKPVQVTFTVVATDNGTGPKDTITIQISPTYSATGNLTSGNITVN